MNGLRTSFIKHKKFLLFLIIIFLIGIISGVIYFNKVSPSLGFDLKDTLESLNYSFNSIYFHCIFISLMCFFSLILVGVFIALFFLFYEAMSIGFIIVSFYSAFGFSGIIYGVIYIVLFKSIYIILLIFIIYRIFNLTRNIIGCLVLKKDCDLKSLAIKNFINIVKLCIFVIINDVLLILLGNKIISGFNFLIN